MNIRMTTLTDDLSHICRQITPGKWGKDNEMTSYDEAALRGFLKDNRNILLLAWDDDNIAGIALCHELPHPARDGSSLYVHELDTHPDYRRQGVATKLMKELFAEARRRNLSEVWLGTETDNDAANALYTSLDPIETEQTVTYTYKITPLS